MENPSMRLSLRSKLLILISLSIVGVGGVFSFMLISEARQSKAVMGELIEHARDMKTIGQISFVFKSEVQAWKDLLIRGTNSDNYKKYSAELEEKSHKVHEMTDELKKGLQSAEGQQLADEFLKAEVELFSNYQTAKTSFLNPENFQMAEADKALKGKDRPVTESLNKLNTVIEKNMETSTLESEQRLASQMKLGFMVAFFVTALVVIMAWTVLRKISLRLIHVTHSLEQVSSNIDGAALEISNASVQLANSNTEAAASIEETSASIEEISSMVKRTTDSMKETNSLAVSGNETALKGEKEMTALITSMNEIKKSSGKMEEIIAVIDDIAFQTNLLALNASVEAARAGEQGKGFAVVADAVRTLAQRSATSAKDISTLIKESVAKIEDGARIAAGNEAVLKDIVVAIRKISQLTSDVSAMGAEQLSGVEQIAKAVSQLDQTSQMNAASAEETSGASMQLKAQTQVLMGSIHDLQSVVEG
jgi:methyl-accepting chemotaxis protein